MTKRTLTNPAGDVIGIDDNNWVKGKVEVELSDLIEHDLDRFLDLLSEKLIGSELLMQISYKAASVNNGAIVLEVEGDVSMHLDSREE